MKLFRKIMVLAIIGLFIGAGVVPSISGNQTICVNNDDELDQYQEIYDSVAYFIYKNETHAQSFIPTLNVITRVELYLFKGNSAVDYELTVSIRKNLYGNDLTQVKLSPEGYLGSQEWIEFDFKDIAVEPGETYYLVCSADEGSRGGLMSYFWCLCQNGLHYSRGCSYSNSIFNDYQWEKDENDLDCCFRTYGYDDSDAHADLTCQGSLSWTDIAAGDIVNGIFTVENTGFAGSLLEWEIVEYPQEWGTWEFTPENGENLTPEDDAEIIEVTVIAPDVKNAEFIGEIKVVNRNNPDDWETIQISLTTPKSINTPFQRLLENHPHIFSLIKYILGL